jgi:hypothetical protein
MLIKLLKILGILTVVGTLIVAVLVAGFLLGLVLSVLIPVVAVFTGLFIIWWGFQDYPKNTGPSAGDGPDDDRIR